MGRKRRNKQRSQAMRRLAGQGIVSPPAYAREWVVVTDGGEALSFMQYTPEG